MWRILAILLVASLTFFAPAIAGYAQGVPGHVIIARTSGDAIVIWDATAVVTSIVNEKLSNGDANDLIEHDALIVAVRAAPSLRPNTRTLTVRIGYNEIGAVNPAYGGATFAGIEHYATLNVSFRDLRKLVASNHGTADNTKKQGNIGTFTIQGELPPR